MKNGESEEYRLVIEGNALYEVDMECVRCRESRRKAAEEECKKARQKKIPEEIRKNRENRRKTKAIKNSIKNNEKTGRFLL